MVILTAVEKTDKEVDKVVKKFIENIKDISSQVKANTIVLYPYAHLSSNLASPELAAKVLDVAKEFMLKLAWMSFF